MPARTHEPRARFMRTFGVKTELRASGDNLTLDGYASVTDTPYDVRDWLGEYTEMVASGAFKKSLAEKDDVRLLFNHDGLPLARTAAGTMTLEEDDTGLHVVAELDRRSSLTNDIAVAMERGDLSQMSFAFSVTKQDWSPDYDQRTIREVRLFDVSVVTFPANPDTSVKLRGAQLVDELSDEDLRELVARAQRRLNPAPTYDPADLSAMFHAAHAL